MQQEAGLWDQHPLKVQGLRQVLLQQREGVLLPQQLMQHSAVGVLRITTRQQHRPTQQRLGRLQQKRPEKPEHLAEQLPEE